MKFRNRWTTQTSDTSQIDRSKALARELGCDEDEAAFESALKTLARSALLPKHEPKKRRKTSSPDYPRYSILPCHRNSPWLSEL